MGLKIGVFTIASKNYLAYVRVLMRSVAQAQPDYARYMCLADTVDGCFDPAQEPFKIVQADRLGIAGFDDMALRYDIMEFNTAVKPSMIQWMLKHTDLDVVIYLDPDIRAYSAFTAIEREFAAGASVVLTPHITRPLEDGKNPNDYHMLQAGVFNLGFIAVRRGADAEAFVAWWARRLATQAVADVPNNLFTDQRWCDLAPCFVDRLAVLKNPGYNTAYWNLAERVISRDADQRWRVNGQPLAFFHFSGVNVERPQLVSKHQDRFSWDQQKDLRPLFDDYLAALRAQGSGETQAWPYVYASVDGLPLPAVLRRVYREAHAKPQLASPSTLREELIARCTAPAPLAHCEGGPAITHLMHLIYTLRVDLQRVFSMADAAGRWQFVHWFQAAAQHEYKLPDAVMPPVQAAPEHLSPDAAVRAAAPAFSAGEQGAARADEALSLTETLSRLWPAMPTEQRHALAPLLHGLLTLAPRAASAAQPTEQASRPDTLSGPRPARSIDAMLEAAAIPSLLKQGHISRLMQIVWQSRADLQHSFDLSSAGGQQDYVNWFAASAPAEYGLQAARVPILATAAVDSLGGLPGANLVGYAHAELGMGEHVRMTAAALSSTDLAYGVINIEADSRSRKQAELGHGELIDRNRHKANIFHVNADQMLRTYGRLGHAFFAKRYNIGYWAWELANCPEPWIPMTELVNEIWAPSSFIQKAFAQVTDIPVLHMPLCVAPGEVQRLGRAHFGLPADSFLFLYVFDFLSFLERKNPQAAIRAFHRAFDRADSRVGLVLKVMHAEPSSPAWRRMLELIDGDPRVSIIDETMDRQNVLSLFETCNAFVSLHRSEGFGRGPAEAMYLGKPVIATNYSGNTDFTLPDNACPVNYQLIAVGASDYPMAQGQVWADADVEHAAWYMRRLASDGAYAEGIGLRGQDFMRQHFSGHAIGRLYAQRLRALGVA